MTTDYLQEFSDTLDAAETDPRPRWKRIVGEIIVNELDRRQVRKDVADDLAQTCLRKLGPALRLTLEESRTPDAAELLSDFAMELRRMVQHEREHARLRVVTAATELERCAAAYHEHAWGGAEHDALVHMIKDGEKIRSIGFWKIELDTREVTRDQVRNFDRPPTFLRTKNWLSMYVSDEAVRDAEERAARRAAPYESGAGPGRIDD
jgi:hypothetical protein